VKSTGSLTRQYTELLKVDGLELAFTPDGLETLADLAWKVNQSTQNIGARRLSTMMERLLESISFDGPDAAVKQVTIDAGYVNSHLEEITRDDDLSRFIL
jgi:ATP-dependent HslUV protease ATP-binding subunit HslU